MANSSSDFRFDFFVSRRDSVAGLAREVAGVLEEDGYRVTVQDYDAAHSRNFVAFIHDALTEAQHLLILHTADYDTTLWTREELFSFLAAPDRVDRERRVGVLRCDMEVPRGLLSGVVFGDLFGVEDKEERRGIILRVARGEAAAARAAPRVFGGTMPRGNPLFTGRVDLLASLHSALSVEGGKAALTQAAVYGLGGVGKTSLARAYIAGFAEHYAGVWWLTATDATAIETGLAALAGQMKLQLPPTASTTDAAKAALDEVARRTGRPFLLVYDNVPDPKLLHDCMPARGARVLVTSRWPDWATQAAEVRVAEMTEADAVTFLQRRAGRQDEPGVHRLARELGYLALALDHAGATAKHSMISFDDYARRAETLIARAPKNAEYPASVAATFELAIETAAREGAAAETLLGLFAWYAPERIPLVLADEFLPEAEREEGLAALIAVSLVTPQTPDETGPVISVHRLVQSVMRARLAAHGKDAEARSLAVQRLFTAYPDDVFNDVATWPCCIAFHPHLLALADRLEADHPSTNLANLLEASGRFMQGRGSLREAETLLRRALAIHEAVVGADHIDAVGCGHNLAHCLVDAGDVATAEPMFHRALAVYQRELGPDHRNTLTCMNDLATVAGQQGRYEKARDQLQRVLEISEEALGVDHEATLRAVLNLAHFVCLAGEPTQASLLSRRALDGFERVLGPNNPITLRSVAELAHCMLALGDVAGALPLFRRVLEARERVLGPDHPDTLTSMNNLGACMESLGDAAGALPLFRRALEMRERILGPEHPNTLHSVNRLAGCLYELSRPVEAEALSRRALDAQMLRLGPEHPDVLTSQNNRGTSLRKAGHPDLAEPYARQCADTSVRVLGEAEPLTRHRRNNLALTLLMLRRTDEARALLALSWAAPCPPRAIVTPAIPFLELIAAVLDGSATVDPIGRLKPLLIGPGLERAPDITHPWDVGYLLDYLREALPPDSEEFLRALLAAINDPSLAPALDRFPQWPRTPAVPLDTPWPDAAADTLQPEPVSA